MYFWVYRQSKFSMLCINSDINKPSQKIKTLISEPNKHVRMGLRVGEGNCYSHHFTF